MTDLYKEALADAKKLKQIAEDDAKKSIVDEITPFIKKMISEEIGGASHSRFFIEQDDEIPPAPEADPAAAGGGLDLAGSEPEGETALDAPVTDPMAGDDLAAGLGDEAEAAPVAANGEDILSATMPDEEGKITVDFEDLFQDVDAVDPEALATGDDLDLGELPGAEEAEAAPVEDPAAVAEPAVADDLSSLEVPEEPQQEELPVESLVYEKFEKSLHKVSEKIDREFFKNGANDLVHESLKTSLFKLLEQHDYLKESGVVPANKAKSTENKLEFLFMKLKEANSGNTYNEKDQRDHSMTSLKEYAAKLFENDSYADDGDKEGTNQPTTADGKHAADVSGVDPNLGQAGPEDLEGREEDGNPGAIHEEMLPGTAGSVDHEPLPNTDPEPGAEEQWAKGEPSLEEEDQDKVIEEALNSLDEEVEAEGSAGFGDTNEDPPVEFEVDDKEIAEAVRDIKKKSIQEKMRALKEASDGSDATESWEDADPEGGDDPAHENLKESAEAKEDDSDAELNEDSSDDDSDSELNEMSDYMGEDDDMEDDMGAPDMGPDMDDGMGAGDDLVLNIDLPDEVADALAAADVGEVDVSVEMGDDVGMGDGDDMGDAAVADVIGGADPMGGDVDVDVDVVDDDDMEESADFSQERAVYEAKLKKAGKLYTEAKKARDKYKTDLREANLFLAKNVYFTKFLQRGDLSQKNLTKIVEYLDNAKNVKEAKAVYGKIKAKLHESATASKKLTGSAAQATTPGSAKSLNESVSRKDTSDPVVSTPSRWQHLAGIKKSES